MRKRDERQHDSTAPAPSHTKDETEDQGKYQCTNQGMCVIGMDDVSPIPTLKARNRLQTSQVSSQTLGRIRYRATLLPTSGTKAGPAAHVTWQKRQSQSVLRSLSGTPRSTTRPRQTSVDRSDDNYEKNDSKNELHVTLPTNAWLRAPAPVKRCGDRIPARLRKAAHEL